jgi:hypothetical protein
MSCRHLGRRRSEIATPDREAKTCHYGRVVSDTNGERGPGDRHRDQAARW